MFGFPIKETTKPPLMGFEISELVDQCLLKNKKRTINILNSQGRIYGLDPEIAWNYGLSFLQGFNLFNNP